jgi:hypothetical protein
MRYLILGFCVFAAACAGEGSGAPTSPSSSIAGVAPTEARGGSELPFKGTLQGTEAINGAQHSIAATGHATLLGQFTLVSEFTVNSTTATGSGIATWTAANGDQIFTTVAGHAVVTPPTVAIMETQTITGGTGRFASASGTFEIDRTLNLVTNVTSASFSGKISLGH